MRTLVKLVLILFVLGALLAGGLKWRYGGGGAFPDRLPGPARLPETAIETVAELPTPPGNIAVRVLNATTTNGLAGRAAADLSRLGFGIRGTGNAPKGSSATDTVVRYGPTRADSAKTVLAAVTGSTGQEVDSLGDKIQLLVGSTYEGVKPVKLASSSQPTVTTGASNPCS